MKRIQLSIASICLLISCNMLNLEKEEQEDSFQPMFTAEINGEPFEGDQNLAAIAKIGKYNWLNLIGLQYDRNFLPYHERISFALTFQKEKSRYDVAPIWILIKNGTNKKTGGRYRESDGDVSISMYEAMSEGDGYITVHMDTLEDGRTVARGTFEMTATKQYRANQYSCREADTLHITGGEYRLLLEDEREEQ